MVSAVSLVASVIAGMGAGVLLLSILARGRFKQAARDAAALAAETRTEAAGIVRAAAERASVEGERLAEITAGEIAGERQGLGEYETDLAERERLVESRERQTRDIESRLGEEDRALERWRETGRRLDERSATAQAELLRRLEAIGGLERREAQAQWIKDQVGRAKLRTMMRMRTAEELLENDAVIASRRIMAVAVDRYDGVGHLERSQNTIQVPDRRTLLTLADTGGAAYAAFLEVVGCELWCDEEAQTLTIRGDDPLGREISRRVLRQLANRSISSPQKVRNIAGHVIGEVEREVQNAAKKAARVLAVEPMHPEIANLVGRLKFRLSYSQNQWKHAIEVGYFCGMLAAEMKLDVKQARRGGLLHDIGKAMTHDHEGSHAVLGAEVARRCGEDEIIANAIGAHHNDETPNSPIANVVAAADAMSGARPGARRENAASYMGRIQEIQRIAAGFPNVERADIMHAGREVRIVVSGEERADTGSRTRDQTDFPDADLQPLAKEIARALEREITYAGQIRVTVIRESRSVAIAR